MRSVNLDKIVTLEDLAERDNQPNGRAWLLWKASEAIKAGKFSTAWDGRSVDGEPVKAFINNGRWGARCKVCNAPQYVSPETPLLFCVECGNGNTGTAWGVEFPENREQIEAALLKRDVAFDESRLIRNVVELSLHVRPSVPGLARTWRAGMTIEMLEAENEEKGSKR